MPFSPLVSSDSEMRLKRANGMGLAIWEGGENPKNGTEGHGPRLPTRRALARRDGWATLLAGRCPSVEWWGFCPTALCVVLLFFDCDCAYTGGGWGSGRLGFVFMRAIVR